MFHLAHLAVILCSAPGWRVPAARPLHPGLQGLILFSRVGLGSIKDWTYGYLTDPHRRVKSACSSTHDAGVKPRSGRLAGRAPPALVKRVAVTVFRVTTLPRLVLYLRWRLP